MNFKVGQKVRLNPDADFGKNKVFNALRDEGATITIIEVLGAGWNLPYRIKFDDHEYMGENHAVNDDDIVPIGIQTVMYRLTDSIDDPWNFDSETWLPTVEESVEAVLARSSQNPQWFFKVELCGEEYYVFDGEFLETVSDSQRIVNYLESNLP